MNKNEKLIWSFIAEKKEWIEKVRKISVAIKMLEKKQKGLKRHIQEADRYIENFVVNNLTNKK